MKLAHLLRVENPSLIGCPVSGLYRQPPTATPAENLPEWLSNLETKSGPDSGTDSGTEPGTPAAILGSEPSSASNLPAETPDWLSRCRQSANTAEEVEKHKEDFGGVPETPASPTSSEPLPDWLAGIASTIPPSSSTPPLVMDNQDRLPRRAGRNSLLNGKPRLAFQTKSGAGN